MKASSHLLRAAVSLVLALSLNGVAAQDAATTISDRAAIVDDIKAAYEREDFSHIEKRFAEMMATDARTASGVTQAGRVFYGVRDAVGRLARSGKTDAHWKLEEEKAARWRRAFPASSLAVYASSNAHIGHAFFFRGTKAAIDVEEKNWPLFRAELKKASDLLIAPEGKFPKDAIWYMAMLELANYQSVGLQNYARLVDEASTKWPAFYDIYFIAVGALQPRWGGSVEAFDWLANMAAEKTRSTDGMALYARVYWSIAQTEGMADLFTKTHADWKKMKVGFDDIVKRFPDAWNYNHYAWFACLARDQTATRLAFEKIGDNLEPFLWSNTALLNRCRNFAKHGE